jgi:hypothetical protein
LASGYSIASLPTSTRVKAADSGAALALVHSPLVGAGCWRGVEAALIASGAKARTLECGSLEGPGRYAQISRRVATAAACLEAPWVLVVHSAAGAFAPAVVERATVAPSAVLFVDAVLPHPGRSWLEAAPQTLAARIRDLEVGGRLPPWHRWFVRSPTRALIADPVARARFEREAPTIPLAFLDEPAPHTSIPVNIPKGFLKLSAAYEHEASTAIGRSWFVGALEGHHLAMLTDPGRVTAAIREMAAAVLQT